MMTVETCNKIALTDARTLAGMDLEELQDAEDRHNAALLCCPRDSEAARLLRRGREAILAEMRRR